MAPAAAGDHRDGFVPSATGVGRHAPFPRRPPAAVVGQKPRHPVVEHGVPPQRARRPQRRSPVLDRLTRAADRFSNFVCGVIGARHAFSLWGAHGATGGVSVASLGLAAGSVLLTTFGGSTQSNVLQWVVARSSGQQARPLQFSWQRAWPHVWACLGFLLAAELQNGGLLGLLDGALWRWILSLNTAIFVASAVVHSGWFASRCQGVEGTASLGPLSALGAFLYTCGGGLWRDLLSVRVPSALAHSNLVPLAVGLLLCLTLHALGNALGDVRGCEGNLVVFTAGIPAVTCLFVAWA